MADTSTVPSLRLLVTLDDSDFSALLAVLSRRYPAQDDLADAIKEALPQLSSKDVKLSISTMIGLVGGSRAAGADDDEIVERGANFYLGEADAQMVSRLREILATPAIQLGAGVISAVQGRGQNIASHQLSMDLTPAVGDEGLGSLLVPTFTLQVNHYDPSGAMSQRTTLTMDFDDVEALGRDVTKVLQQLRDLQAKFSSKGILIWTGEENADD